MLYDDPLHDSREASDEAQAAYAAAVYAAAVARREREAVTVAAAAPDRVSFWTP
jgi:hypothetical protein